MLNRFKNKITRSKFNSHEVSLYYEEWTERYIRSFGNVFQSHRPDNLQIYFEYLVKQIGIKQDMNVLDAGCGIGGPLFGIQKIAPNTSYYGLNISAEQINIAANSIESTDSKKIHFNIGDFHCLSKVYDNDFFDRVFFLESLVHSNNIDKVIEECHKVLKPYGQLYIKDLYRRVPISKDDNKLIEKSVIINNDLFKMNIDTKENLLLILTSPKIG